MVVIKASKTVVNQGSIYALDGSHIEHFYILSVSLTSEP